MSTTQAVLLQKLSIILQRGLVEVRNLALSQRCQQIYDLADTLEVLPPLLARWEDKHLAVVRDGLAHYQSKHKEAAYDYLSILDMDEAAFRDVYLSGHRWQAGDGEPDEEEPFAVA
jgi:hypothetical protein